VTDPKGQNSISSTYWRCSPSELADGVASFGFKLSDEELERLTDEAERIIQDSFVGLTPAQRTLEAAPLAESWPPTEDDDPLNAFIHRCRLRCRANGPLSGLRIAVKANIAVAGLELSCGSPVLRGFHPTRNATAVDRLLQAGAEIVAIANMDDLGVSGDGTTGCYGAVRNPNAAELCAGGSSAGSAAGLAYDNLDASLGTDQGGSIRIPASWCGVLGLKPTYGAIPYTGIVGLDRGVDHVGPLARDVDTLSTVFAAIEGASGGDSRTRNIGSHSTVRCLEFPNRIALLREGFELANSDVQNAVHSALDDLRRGGITVDEISIPQHTYASRIATLIGLEGAAATLEAGGNGYGWVGQYWPELAEALHNGLRTSGHLLAPHVKLTLALGLHLRRRYGGALYARAQEARIRLTDAYDRALSRQIPIVMPSTPFPAQPVATTKNIAEQLRRGWSSSANTHAANLTGHPALSLPVAHVQGLPIGLMVVGREGDEWRLLDLARHIERNHGWREPKPLRFEGQRSEADS